MSQHPEAPAAVDVPGPAPVPSSPAEPRPGAGGPLAWRPGARVVRGTMLGVLVMNVVIVLTGVAVQLTGSGLGCPTWPECTAGSFVPTKALGYHSVIEFSNRMLTYVLCVAVGAAIIAAMRARPRRRVVVWLSWSQFGGVVAQAVVGGISVLTHLAPIWVAAHFMVSVALIGLAYLAWVRSGESDRPTRLLVRRDLRVAARLLAACVVALVVAGTVVTGSDPQSGSKDATKRFPLTPETATQFHADLVFLVTGLAVALWFGLRATNAPVAARHATRDLFWLIMAQGVIGYAQYFTKLPVGLVELHMLGACLVWIATLRVLVRMRERTREDESVESAEARVPAPSPASA